MMVTVFRCRWQYHYVYDFFPHDGDFLMLTIDHQHAASQSCHQHTLSSTSVTNIDDAVMFAALSKPKIIGSLFWGTI